MNVHPLLKACAMLTLGFAGFACSRPGHAAEIPAPDEDLATPQGDAGEASSATAVLAGGCFWCTEAVFEQLEGVASVVSGYAGGTAESANYQAVSGGRTDHAEAIQITYDPSVVSYGELLHVFFSVAHDPTQLNRQGPDTGKQYRSAVFYANEDEQRVAKAYIDQLNTAGVFDKPIATTLEPLDHFYEAEAYHQDYAVHNPGNPYISINALPKVEKVRKQFADEVKPSGS